MKHLVTAFTLLFASAGNVYAACGNGDLHFSYHTKDPVTGQTAVNYATRAWADTSWTIEKLEDGDSTLIPRTNLVLDKQSLPHISYAIQGTTSYVKHSFKNPGDACSTKEIAYQSSPMMPTQSVGNANSIAVDSTGRVTIVHAPLRSNQSFLAHEDKGSGGWTHAEVAAPVMSGAPVSQTWVSIPPTNLARTTFLGSQPVTFSLNFMDNWAPPVVVEKDVTASCYSTYGATSVTDKRGYTHIAYYCWIYQMPSTCTVKYANNVNGNWTTETVASVNSVMTMGTNACTDPVVKAGLPVASLVASVMVDSLDRPAIAFTAPVENRIRYATNASGSWVANDVDNGGWFASLMPGTTDLPNIGYWNGAGAARFASYTTTAGWKTETIDATNVDETGTLGVTGVQGRSNWR